MTSAFVGVGLSIQSANNKTLDQPARSPHRISDIFKSNNTNCCEPAPTEIAIAYPSLY
ncbi:hypothetical protein [Chroococcidiopsis sp.]|uniref:hypothetical protein n=1 Tax=Chroococcidiopsis sp. TaxID=3088168 RepID=UPI003F401F92